MKELFIYRYIIDKIDIGTLAILFCLMAVVAGFDSLGYFDRIASRLIQKASTLRLLMMSVVMSIFFLSMLVTNDVGLIIMVPFTIQVFHTVGRSDKLIKVIVLETIAANLGSMLTPIGNPQNVYLYQHYHLGLPSFTRAVLPYALASAALLTVFVLCDAQGKVAVHVRKTFAQKETGAAGKRKYLTAVYLFLFLICICAVMDVIHYGIMLAVVTVGLAAANRRLFRAVNYALLGKFVVLFVVVGNLADISWIGQHLQALVSGNEFFAGVALSQLLSNVPTAIILSKFTSNGAELLTGVNVGGLGTLIASMASVISLEYYGKTQGAQKGKYVARFTLYNVIFLVCLIAVHCVCS